MVQEDLALPPEQPDADPDDYLSACEVIDFKTPEIAKLANELAQPEVLATAKQCFEFVRDEIRHSSDYKLNPVTCDASQTLEHRTGYCYAKARLLCALLRANSIPAGLCYQRLSVDGVGEPYCLHGLNAVYLPEFGWYRVDARGNREGIRAEFDPPRERLAFPTNLPGEYDLPGIHAKPLSNVIEALQEYEDWEQLYANLPDVQKAQI